MTQLAGHLIVDCLIAQGVQRAYGVPGESYLAVLDGFHAYRDRLRFITCRQEGGAAFMAEAEGKLTGRPGVRRRPRKRTQPDSIRTSSVPLEVCTPLMSSISARVTGW